MNRNSIVDFSSLPVNVLFRILLENKTPLPKVFVALLANLSQKSDKECLAIIQQSKLVEILTTFKELVNSAVIDDLDVNDLLRQNFSNLQQGEQHLIAVLAFLQLLRSPGDAETPEEAEDLAQKIEDLKSLFRLTLFHSSIAIHLMSLRDEMQDLIDICPCHGCNARYICSIGWFIASQEAHNKDVFAANSN